MRVSAMCDDCQKMQASVNVPPTTELSSKMYAKANIASIDRI